MDRKKYWICGVLIAMCLVFFLICSNWGGAFTKKPVVVFRSQAAHVTSHGEIETKNQTFFGEYMKRMDVHGIVVDQHEKPISGVSVKATVLDSPFGTGAPPVDVVTDSSGAFSFHDLKGAQVGVEAKKAGYICYEPLGPVSSSVVLTDPKIASLSHPVILVLHDPGPMEPLLHIDYQRWKLSPDGAVRKIFLDSEDGKSGKHAIEFRFVTKRFLLPEAQIYGHQYDWSFEMRIAGGGFSRNENDLKMVSCYQFEAPESGYQESVRYDFPAALPPGEWVKFRKDSFFVKFEDGTFGRIRFSVEGSTDGSPLLMETWYNPKAGSRNLASLYK